MPDYLTTPLHVRRDGHILLAVGTPEPLSDRVSLTYCLGPVVFTASDIAPREARALAAALMVAADTADGAISDATIASAYGSHMSTESAVDRIAREADALGDRDLHRLRGMLADACSMRAPL